MSRSPENRHSIAHVPLEELDQEQMISRRGFHEHIIEISMGTVFGSFLVVLLGLSLRGYTSLGWVVTIAALAICIVALVAYFTSAHKVRIIDDVDAQNAQKFFASLREEVDSDEPLTPHDDSAPVDREIPAKVDHDEQVRLPSRRERRAAQSRR